MSQLLHTPNIIGVLRHQGIDWEIVRAVQGSDYIFTWNGSLMVQVWRRIPDSPDNHVRYEWVATTYAMAVDSSDQYWSAHAAAQLWEDRTMGLVCRVDFIREHRLQTAYPHNSCVLDFCKELSQDKDVTGIWAGHVWRWSEEVSQ